MTTSHLSNLRTRMRDVMGMINKTLSFHLPRPWVGEKFETSRIGSINFLVGPNRSGKSRFAQELKPCLEGARLLGTDRLSGMEQINALRNQYGDTFLGGFAKNQFGILKEIGLEGSGIDTILLLEERIDLRIQVQATLSHLFNRNGHLNRQ